MGISGTDKALMYALSGVARSGATRSGYHSPKPFTTINGTHYATGRSDDSQKVLYETLTITENNRAANVASFVTSGFVPTIGQEVIVTLGSVVARKRLFAGQIAKTKRIYEGVPTNYRHQVEVFDFTRGLSRLLVTGHFTGSAGEIAAALMAAYAPGYTANNIAADLDTVEGGITFTAEDLITALNRLADRVGADWYIDYYKDLHFFLTDTSTTAPQTLTSSLTTLLPGLTVMNDASDVITRVVVAGGGGSTLTYADAGETLLPIDAPEWYLAGGGTVRANSQYLDYAGIELGGAGALIGTGVGPPSNAAIPTAAVHSTGLGTGDYRYKTSFVTAAGETLCGPQSAVVTLGGALAPPPKPGFMSSPPGGSLVFFGAYTYRVTYVTSTGGETAMGAFLAVQSSATSNQISIPVSADPIVTQRKIYRTTAGDPMADNCKLLDTIANNTTASYTDVTADGSLGSVGPLTSTALYKRVSLSSVPISPDSAVTSRKLYRTVAGGAVFKLLDTIANNSTTTYADSIADGSLGADEPSTDTSGIAGANNQVPAGSTTIPVSSSTPFLAGGGWARVQSQVIRYTGLTAFSLTGVPATGPGALTASVSYRSELVACAMLTGIPASGSGSIVRALVQGEEVDLIATVDDAAAQAALAALIGGDGIVEGFIQDRRLSYDECVARALAFLALVKDVLVTVSYASRDLNNRAGQLVDIDLADSAAVEGQFRIQQVTRTAFEPAVHHICNVVASSRLFELADLLQEIRRQRF